MVELELEFFCLEWLNKCRESTSDVSTKLYCHSTQSTQTSRSFVKYSITVQQRVLKSFLFGLFNFGSILGCLLMHCFVNNPNLLKRGCMCYLLNKLFVLFIVSKVWTFGCLRWLMITPAMESTSSLQYGLILLNSSFL